MKETPQEYIKRITSYVEGEQPMKVQAATPKKLERLIRGVSFKSVEQFRVVREANLVLLKSLTQEQWKHHGIHSERGVETVEHIVRMFAGHDVNHIRQIEHILTP